MKTTEQFDTASRSFVWAIFGIGALISLVLSIWSIGIDSVINNDGVIYVRAAELLSSGDWGSALGIYRWPFYPWLIMLVGDTLGISYKVAGHSLNSIFFALVVIFFVDAVRAFGAVSRLALVTALVIALAHPAFNEYRAFLIRDPGYLAAYLLAVCCFARHCRQPLLRYRVIAAACLVVATLFRVEGLVFLFCSPMLFNLTNSRISSYGTRHWIVLLVSIVLIVGLGSFVFSWLLTMPTSQLYSLNYIGSPVGLMFESWSQIAAGVNDKLGILRAFLGPYSASNTYMLFGLAVIAVLGAAILNELTVPFSLLIVYALLRPTANTLQGSRRNIWAALLLLNVLVLLVFTCIFMFLAPRYPLAICMTLLLLVPFAASEVWARARSISFFGRCIVLLLLTWAVGESWSGVSNFSRNDHHRTAGIWIAENSDESAVIVTNSRKVAYYAGHYNEPESWGAEPSDLLRYFSKKDESREADFVVVELSRDDTALATRFSEGAGVSPIQIFDNGHGDWILIFPVTN